MLNLSKIQLDRNVPCRLPNSPGTKLLSTIGYRISKKIAKNKNCIEYKM